MCIRDRPVALVLCTGAVGTGVKWAREDHRHPLPAGSTYFLHMTDSAGSSSRTTARVQEDFYGVNSDGVKEFDNASRFKFPLPSGLPTLEDGDEVQIMIMVALCSRRGTSNLDGWTANSPTTIGYVTTVRAIVDKYTLDVSDIEDDPDTDDYETALSKSGFWRTGTNTVKWIVSGSASSPDIRIRLDPAPLSNTAGSQAAVLVTVPWIMVGRGGLEGTALEYELD